MLGLLAAGTADVYNLSVDGEEEYFANGVLVHNCRYLLMSIGGGAEFLTLPASVDPDSQIAPLPMMGQFAYRPSDAETGTGWLDDEDAPVRGAVQTSPFL